jgi:hypothetical protein
LLAAFIYIIYRVKILIQEKHKRLALLKYRKYFECRYDIHVGQEFRPFNFYNVKFKEFKYDFPFIDGMEEFLDEYIIEDLGDNQHKK